MSRNVMPKIAKDFDPRDLIHQQDYLLEGMVAGARVWFNHAGHTSPLRVPVLTLLQDARRMIGYEPSTRALVAARAKGLMSLFAVLLGNDPATPHVYAAKAAQGFDLDEMQACRIALHYTCLIITADNATAVALLERDVVCCVETFHGMANSAERARA